MIRRYLDKICFSSDFGRQMRFVAGPRQVGKTTLAKSFLERQNMPKKHRCLHCREYPGDESMIKTPVGWFCGSACALAYTVKKREKAAERKRKAERKVLKAKVDGSDPKKQKALTRDAFNKMRRLEELLWFQEHL